MTRPTTRSKNSSQRPGQVVLDTKQKRRTSEQKQADDAQAEQLRLEQVEAREQAVQRVAKIIEQTEQEAKDLLANAPKPRPRIVVKPPVDPSVQQDNPEAGSGGRKGVSGSPSPEDDSESVDAHQEEGDNERLTQLVPSKKPRTQKTFTRNAVEAARSNYQHESDVTDVGSQSSRQPENLRSREPAPNIQAKNSIAGTGGTGDWADKLAAFKSSHPTQRSSSSKLNSRHARTVSSASVATSLLTQDPQETSVSAGTRASSPTDRASSPTNHASSPTNETQLTLGPQDPYIQGSDECERKVMPNLPSKVVQATRRTNAMRVAEVVSDSEPGEWGNEDSRLGAPPSKRTKGGSRSTSGSQRSGSGVNKKFVNNDLPHQQIPDLGTVT
ncbi:hypothetical protein EV363DRAFT_1452995 [Boletus edulis]|nr:hypothetical protein EV363DRAFT_1452995 [Boletus edulis]